jgi:hypothetical protein
MQMGLPGSIAQLLPCAAQYSAPPLPQGSAGQPPPMIDEFELELARQSKQGFAPVSTHVPPTLLQSCAPPLLWQAPEAQKMSFTQRKHGCPEGCSTQPPPPFWAQYALPLWPQALPLHWMPLEVLPLLELPLLPDDVDPLLLELDPPMIVHSAEQVSPGFPLLAP